MACDLKTRLLFDAPSLSVNANCDPTTDKVLITFTGRTTNPPAVAGFAEHFSKKYDISGIFFITKNNNWWLSSETLQAIDAIKAAGYLDRKREIVLYGSSMGGYGALLFSKALNATHVYAVVPQYSIRPGIVTEETRWKRDVDRIDDFSLDNMDSGISQEAEITVIYDPFYLQDAAHVKRIAVLRPINVLPITFTNHNTSAALQEIGLLSSMAKDFVSARFNHGAFLQEVRSRRRKSSLFWHGLGIEAQRRNKPDIALIALQNSWSLVRAGSISRRQKLRVQIARDFVAMLKRHGMDSEVVALCKELDRTGISDGNIQATLGMANLALGDLAQAQKCAEIAKTMPNLTRQAARQIAAIEVNVLRARLRA